MSGSNPRLILHNQPLLTKTFASTITIDLSCTNIERKRDSTKRGISCFDRAGLNGLKEISQVLLRRNRETSA